MERIDPIRLWRVEIVNRNGYEAPYLLIEAKKKDVHKEVRNLNLRLLDFPENWSYRVIDLQKTFNVKRSKWF